MKMHAADEVYVSLKISEEFTSVTCCSLGARRDVPPTIQGTDQAQRCRLGLSSAFLYFLLQYMFDFMCLLKTSQHFYVFCLSTCLTSCAC